MLFRWLTERRRARLLEHPLLDAWRGHVQQHLRDLVVPHKIAGPGLASS